MTILRHPSLPEVEPKPLRFTFGCKFVAESFPSLPRITGPLGDDEEDAAQKWNDWVRPLVELQEEVGRLADIINAIMLDRDRLKADLAAANARADDLMGHIQLSASTHPKECSCHLCDLVALNDQPEQPT